MGREVVKNGVALGRTLYLGHGTRATQSPCGQAAVVFENSAEMRAAGFTPYCKAPMDQPPLEDDSELSRHLRVAGIAFAARCAFMPAKIYMKEENANSFTYSMGRVALDQLGLLRSPLPPDMFFHYIDLPGPSGSIFLNQEQPGTNDFLSVLLGEAVKQVGIGAVGFQRSEPFLGFRSFAVPLVVETVKMVEAATQQFGW